MAFHHDAAAYDSVYSLCNAEYFIKKIGVTHLPFVSICMSITTVSQLHEFGILETSLSTKSLTGKSVSL